MLAEFPEVVIVGEAGEVEEAQRKIEDLAPALLFLDIQMPGGSGFDLLARLEQVPQVVFTTAYDAHAVRAFEVNALDYLLKPIAPQRLAEALSRVRSASRPPAPDGHLEQLFIRDGSHCWFAPLKEIRLFTAEGNYVRVSWRKIKPLLGRSLLSVERRLDPKRFFRANRRQIVNLDLIESVDMGIGGRLHAGLDDGSEIEISRRQARLFKSQAR